MQNYFANEVEAAHRRHEWERALAAAQQETQARPMSGSMNRGPLTLVFTYLRSLGMPQQPHWSWASAVAAKHRLRLGTRASARADRRLTN